MTQEALTMALEALEFIPKSGSMLGTHAEAKRLEAITAIKEALAQRTWVNLTRTQMQDVYFEVLKEHRGGHQMDGQLAFGEALQAKIKEKNT